MLATGVCAREVSHLHCSPLFYHQVSPSVSDVAQPRRKKKQKRVKRERKLRLLSFAGTMHASRKSGKYKRREFEFHERIKDEMNRRMFAVSLSKMISVAQKKRRRGSNREVKTIRAKSENSIWNACDKAQTMLHTVIGNHWDYCRTKDTVHWSK